METLVDLVKLYLLPGSSIFLLLGMSGGVILLFLDGPAQRWGRRIILSFVLLYWALSTPLVVGMLEDGLGRDYGSLGESAITVDVQAVILLGGGAVTHRVGESSIDVLSEASALRTLEAAQVFAHLGAPVLIVSGGLGEREGAQRPEALALVESLVDLGVPRDRMILETESRNTLEQAVNIRSILEAQGIQRAVLVTSRIHMWRSVGTFRRQGMEVLPSAAPNRSESLPRQPAWVPNSASLQASHTAFREIFALIYYWGRGWLGAG